MPFDPQLFWKRAPFIRLLIPFFVGIIIQWYKPITLTILGSIFTGAFLVALSLMLFTFENKLKFSWLTGLMLNVLFISSGALFARQNDIRNSDNWFANARKESNKMVVALLEDPIEKARSFKADAQVRYIFQDGKPIVATGTVILYFSKDSLLSNISSGSVIILNKPLQEIKNAGNPGSFDYKRFCLFKGITHQVFLTTKDYALTGENNQSLLSSFIGSIRKNVLEALRKYIPGEKEKGLAEALLIGYKDDLDKSLVQSYSNTGVVHIIAISGLHLGLIYVLLLRLLKPLQRRKQTRWLRPVIIIAGLWLFSLLAGAQPSVLRSAVMFTCIVIGECINRKTSIYNSLAASAFILLCYNPYWLWDVGFQLSYAAVLSIVIFMQPVYNWMYVQNKSLDFLWKMTAVTIAAQILTVPLSIFHFHQFPNYFLFTNFIAVPLSSMILLGEIALCIFAWITPLAVFLGKILYGLIWFMNTWVERVESLPFSLWEGMQVSIIQTVLLFVAIAFISYWLFEKNKKALIGGLVAICCFGLLQSIDKIHSADEQKLIVYNVPGKTAMDVAIGNHFTFIGNSSLLVDDFTRNFHIKPSRVLNRLYNESEDKSLNDQTFLSINNHKILRLNENIAFKPNWEETPKIDLLLLSGKQKISISKLANNLSIKQIVFDGSVPAWKSKQWKKDCDSLHIACYDVSEKGAFVMNLR